MGKPTNNALLPDSYIANAQGQQILSDFFLDASPKNSQFYEVRG